MAAKNSSELLAYAQAQGTIKKEKVLSGWKGYKTEGNTILCTAEKGGLAVSVISETIVRVRAWLGEYQSTQETGIVRVFDARVSAEKSPKLHVEETAHNTLQIRSKSLDIIINKSDFTLSILCRGHQVFSDSRPLSWNRQSFTISHGLLKSESVYGLGEKTGYLEKNENSYEMWNTDVYAAHTASTDPLYVSVPFYVKLGQGYATGFYLDNSWKTQFDIGETNSDVVSVSAPAGNLDYYVIAGETLPSVLQGYCSLTGNPALPPRWALGHHQSRYSYKNEHEVLAVGDGFTQRDLECASIHLDIHYMDENRTFTWDEDAFPNPKELSKKLKQDGIRLTAIIDPAIKIDPRYTIYREMIEGGFHCQYMDGSPFVGTVWAGKSVFPDFTRKEVRLWWGEKIVAFMNTHGVEGIWHDMNEPAVFNETSTMDVKVAQGEAGIDTHERYHNLYAYYECMASFEAIKKSLKTRPFILSRAGFSGIQKYAALWTGDNRSMWEHLELSLPMLLNMGMSGLPFVGADTGGFSSNATSELLVRWYQLGMFYPFARNHCSIGSRNQEPWAFNTETEELIIKSMRLRESLMPDFYTSFYLASTSAKPVMRALVWDYPNDPSVRHIYDQFLFGNGLMGAPVLRPKERVRQLYLPKGIWFDWHSGAKLEGNRWILAQTPLEKMPLFIRAGSFLVTDEKEANSLTLTLWYDPSISVGDWSIYSDDGISFDHKTGSYTLDSFSWEQKDNTLTLTQKTDGNSEFRNHSSIRFIIKNLPESANVSVDGKPINAVYTVDHTEVILCAEFKKALFHLK